MCQRLIKSTTAYLQRGLFGSGSGKQLQGPILAMLCYWGALSFWVHIVSLYRGLFENVSFQGFYTVYKEVFKKLAAEDYDFLDNKESDYEFPEFGTSQSDYDEVRIYSK